MARCLNYFAKLARKTKKARKRLQFRVDRDSGIFQQSHSTSPFKLTADVRVFLSSFSISIYYILFLYYNRTLDAV